MAIPLSKKTQEAVEQIVQYMKKTHPYLFIIHKEVEKTDNGMVSITLRVFNGQVQDVIVHDRTKRYKVEYSKEGSRAPDNV